MDYLIFSVKGTNSRVYTDALVALCNSGYHFYVSRFFFSSENVPTLREAHGEKQDSAGGSSQLTISFEEGFSVVIKISWLFVSDTEKAQAEADADRVKTLLIERGYEVTAHVTRL